MCEPTTIMAVAAVASAAVGAYGMHQQARAQKSALAAEADATDRERISADQKADDQAERIGMQVSQARGRQEAVLASSGVDMNFGSAASIRAANDYYGLRDQTTAARNAADVDFNYRDRARQLRSGSAQIRPWMAAGGSLLSSSGKVAQAWYNYKAA